MKNAFLKSGFNHDSTDYWNSLLWIFEFFYYFFYLLFIETGVCKSHRHKCNPASSFCVPYGNNSTNNQSFRCQCKDGYVYHQEGDSATRCIDYCEAGFDYCGKPTTQCVPTPGVGPNYRCDCTRRDHLKQGYYQCAGPLPIEGMTSGTCKYEI